MYTDEAVILSKIYFCVFKNTKKYNLSDYIFFLTPRNTFQIFIKLITVELSDNHVI